MSHTENAIAEIAKLELTPGVVPTQHEVREFVRKFSDLSTHVDEYRKFSNDYNTKHSMGKWWDNNVARDKMLSSIATIGELSVLANKLLALNVAFAQKIDRQTTDILTQGGEIEKNQSVLKSFSHQLQAVQSSLVKGLEESHRQINDMQLYQEHFDSSLVALQGEVDISRSQIFGLEKRIAELLDNLNQETKQLNETIYLALRQETAHKEQVSNELASIKGDQTIFVQKTAEIFQRLDSKNSSIERSETTTNAIAALQQDMDSRLEKIHTLNCADSNKRKVKEYVALGVSVIALAIALTSLFAHI